MQPSLCKYNVSWRLLNKISYGVSGIEIRKMTDFKAPEQLISLETDQKIGEDGHSDSICI